MTINTSVFKVHTTAPDTESGNAESRSSGAQVNNPDGLTIAQVGNPDIKATGKSAMMMRFNLQVPDSGLLIPDTVGLIPRPIIKKVDLELMMAATPVVEDVPPGFGFGQLRLGQMLIIFSAWLFDAFAFDPGGYPLKRDLPFPTDFDDAVIANKLTEDVFLTSVDLIAYNFFTGTTGSKFNFFEGFTRTDPSAEMNDFVSSFQVHIDTMVATFTTAYGLVLDGFDLPLDTGAIENIDFFTSFGESTIGGAIGPRLTVEWDDGFPIVDAGLDDTVAVNVFDNLTGSASFPTSAPSSFTKASVDFNGVDELIEGSTFEALGMTDASWSVFIDMKPSTIPLATGRVVDIKQSGTDNNRIEIFVPRLFGDSNCSVRMKVTSSSGVVYKDLTWTDLIPIDDWSQVIVTYFGSVAGDPVTLFVNGVDQGVADTIVSDGTDSVLDVARKLTIANTFSGVVHEVALWSAGLTVGNTVAIYNNGKSQFSLVDIDHGYFRTDAILHWYRLGLDSGDIGKDYAGTYDLDVQTNIDSSDITEDIPGNGQNLQETIWSVDSAPLGSTVHITDVKNPTSQVYFDLPGVYTLRLTASEYPASVFDTVDWTVTGVPFAHCPDAGSDVIKRVKSESDATIRVKMESDMISRVRTKSDAVVRLKTKSDVSARISVESDVCRKN